MLGLGKEAVCVAEEGSLNTKPNNIEIEMGEVCERACRGQQQSQQAGIPTDGTAHAIG